MIRWIRTIQMMELVVHAVVMLTSCSVACTRTPQNGTTHQNDWLPTCDGEMLGYQYGMGSALGEWVEAGDPYM